MNIKDTSEMQWRNLKLFMSALGYERTIHRNWKRHATRLRPNDAYSVVSMNTAIRLYNTAEFIKENTMPEFLSDFHVWDKDDQKALFFWNWEGSTKYEKRIAKSVKAFSAIHFNVSKDFEIKANKHLLNFINNSYDLMKKELEECDDV